MDHKNSTADDAMDPQRDWLGIGLAAAGITCFCLVRSVTASHQLLGLLISLAVLWPLVKSHTGHFTLRESRYLASYRDFLPWMAVLIGCLTADLYLLSMHSAIGDVDLFYFLCYARDMQLGERVSENAYSYFPGVYLFWRTILTIAGDTTSVIQSSHLLLLATNSLLVAAIVWRMSGRLLLSLFAAAWSVLLYSRFQGLEGTSEPLATIPFLVGLFLWNGRPLRHRRGLRDAVILGISIGLTVYAKQQAGLLSLGVLALLLDNRNAEPGRRHQWKILPVIPLVAVLTLLLGILCEGRGWLPLTQGLATLGGYGQEGSIWHNLYVQVRRDETAAIAIAFSLLVLIRWHLNGSAGCEKEHRQRSVLTLLILAALASFWQLKSRAFHHYMLLAIPPLSIGATLAWSCAWQWRRDVHPTHRPLCLLLLLMPAVPFLLEGQVPESFLAGRFPRPVAQSIPLRWHQHAGLLANARQIDSHLADRAEVLLLPARHTSLHWLLNTRSASETGYSFQLGQYFDGSWIDQIDAQPPYVILQVGALDATDRGIWNSRRQQEAHDRLMNSGYQQLIVDDYLVLYQLRIR